MICDDYWHPGQTPSDGIAPLLEHGFDIDIIKDVSGFEFASLSEYQVVILCKSAGIPDKDITCWRTEDVQQAFITYVENGGGLLVIHSGLVAGEKPGAFDQLIGSKFSFHPQECPVTVQAIKPHPVTNGVEMFCEVDEQYRLEILADDIDIFLASYSPQQGDETQINSEPYQNSNAWIGAAGYCRTQGNGRVCVLTPGHHVQVWLNKQFQRLLQNALNWCAVKS